MRRPADHSDGETGGGSVVRGRDSVTGSKRPAPSRPLDPDVRRRMDAQLYAEIRAHFQKTPLDEADAAWSDEAALRGLQDRVAALVLDARFGRRSGPDLAQAMDAVLGQLARGQAALELKIGELLVPMQVGNRMLKVGPASRRDFYRTVLDMSQRSGEELAQLSRALRSRPILAQAVRDGRVSKHKALAILSLAKGEEEAIWVDHATRCTVSVLRKLVKAFGGTTTEEETFRARLLMLTPAQRARVDEAERLARREIGAEKRVWMLHAAIAAEYLSSFGAPAAEGAKNDDAEPITAAERDALLEAWRRHAREVARRLGESVGHPSAQEAEAAGDAASTEDGHPSAQPDDEAPPPPDFDPANDPHALRDRLRALATLLGRWWRLFAELAFHFKRLKLWRHLDVPASSFQAYCTERLRLCLRAVNQHIWLEGRLQKLPPLRAALDAGTLDYTRARAVAEHATLADIDARIAEATDRPSLDVQTDAETETDGNLSAQGKMRLFGPEDAAEALDLATRSAMALARRRGEGAITPGEAFARVCDHFVEIWSVHGRPPLRGRRARVMRRCGGICEVPECSNAAHHVHHIIFRSRGGPHADWNLVGICPFHHLFAIHEGYMRVTGRAGELLVWEIGLHRDVPRETYLSILGAGPLRVSAERARSAKDAAAQAA